MAVELDLSRGCRLNGDLSAPEAALAGAGLEEALGRRRDRADDWITWAARNRLNGLFVHVITGSAPVGGAPEAVWRERRPEAVALARQRGMTIEHGGHLLPELLPRAQIRALGEGQGPSEAVRRRIVQHVRAHPEADVLHLWGADRPPGARGEDASNAALRTANALAAVAEHARPGTEVPFLAYHDTEEVPRGVRPRGNVGLLFAPRERCYEHALTDPGCRRNRRYRELLLAHVDHFGAADGRPAQVFEYWFDALLFSEGVPDLASTMARDLAFYREAGVHTVQMLATGHRRAPSPHPNPPAFARLAWSA